MKRIVLIALIAWSTMSSARQIIFKSPLSDRLANYAISVTLDAQKKMLHGNETLIWHNKSLNRIKELQFHLYLNAFKNSQSTFMKESHGRYNNLGEQKWGWIHITKMVVGGGEDLTKKIEFIHPDDTNVEDQTVIRVPLKKSIRRGRSMTLDIEFDAQLPSIFARTGFHKNFFMVAQWFPKIGVYEAIGDRYATRGGWNCHQFHSETEFFADYGVYDVKITVPQNYVVGAVGVLQQENTNSDGTKTEMYHAEDVHDFSWAASPDFVVVDDQWQGVKIRLLTQQYKIGDISALYLKSIKIALQHFNDCVGVYPYPNITIVDPPLKASNAGGMEYPTLITSESLWGLPKGIRMVETVTIHEFGHQYWYGLVGSNEFEEAWLDEGITQYYETRIMDDVYGKQVSSVDIPGLNFGDYEISRSGYTNMNNPKIAPTLLPAWKYNAGGYDGMTYMKSTVILTTLERMLGRKVMDEIMREYFERWKFKHPCTRDFIAVVNEIVPMHYGSKYGENMNWFFDQLLSGTNICDYELARINVSEVNDSISIIKNQEPRYESHVLVSRLGEVTLPVDILVRFDNGKELRESWDGQERYKQFVYIDTAQVVYAVVDPDNVLSIDINGNNNSKTTQPSSLPFWKYTAKFMVLVQTILQSALIF